jgi:hypothetical protein
MYYPMIPTDAMAYHEGRIRENKHLYLVSAARLARPRLHARLLARVGRILASAGTRLRERYEPAFVSGPEVSATAAGKAEC